MKLAIQQWTEGKSPVIGIIAPQIAFSAEACFIGLNQIREGRLKFGKPEKCKALEWLKL